MVASNQMSPGLLAGDAMYQGNKGMINNYLSSDRKYRPEVTAALMGNIDVETGGSFDYLQEQSGGGPGRGLFQLEGSKKEDYNNYLNDNGLEDSPRAQLDYMHETIYGDLQDEIGRGNAAKLRKIFETGNVEEITKAFEEIWERPGIPHSDRRLASAKSFINES